MPAWASTFPDSELIIGTSLLIRCLKGAGQMGLKRVMNLVLAENRQMLQLGRKLGFSGKRVQAPGEYVLSIDVG